MEHRKKYFVKYAAKSSTTVFSDSENNIKKIICKLESNKSKYVLLDTNIKNKKNKDKKYFITYEKEKDIVKVVGRIGEIKQEINNVADRVKEGKNYKILYTNVPIDFIINAVTKNENQ